jgi:hypothetical protein
VLRLAQLNAEGDIYVLSPVAEGEFSSEVENSGDLEQQQTSTSSNVTFLGTSNVYTLPAT